MSTYDPRDHRSPAQIRSIRDRLKRKKENRPPRSRKEEILQATIVVGVILIIIAGAIYMSKYLK